MSRIVRINSGDVRLFASQLKEFNSNLASGSARLRAQFQRLGETWQDPQYATFAQEFGQTMENLRRFQHISDDVVPRLLRLAEHIDSTPQV
jgi:uncharacterized protein YukE